MYKARQIDVSVHLHAQRLKFLLRILLTRTSLLGIVTRGRASGLTLYKSLDFDKGGFLGSLCNFYGTASRRVVDLIICWYSCWQMRFACSRDSRKVVQVGSKQTPRVYTPEKTSGKISQSMNLLMLIERFTFMYGWITKRVVNKFSRRCQIGFN